MSFKLGALRIVEFEHVEDFSDAAEAESCGKVAVQDLALQYPVLHIRSCYSNVHTTGRSQHKAATYPETITALEFGSVDSVVKSRTAESKAINS